MKHILLFGAGKSATCLIEYLIPQLHQENWHLQVCDMDQDLAISKTREAPYTSVTSVNVMDDDNRKKLIREADIVISMLPPSLHFLVAKDCVEFRRHLVTASYVDDQTRSIEKEITDAGLIFLCETGLDPGIDHMSSMKMIRHIQQDDGNITSFISHCGGLVAPESDDNPWHYKITWNPRNIVLAGKDGAEYLKDGKVLKVPYNAVFRDCPPVNVIDNYPLCWYPNRDSLHYTSLYGLKNAKTFIRTTLRHPAFCRGWNKFVNIGLTDTNDHDQVKNCRTFEDWWNKKTARFTEHRKDWNNYLHLYITDPFRNEFHKQNLFLGIESKDEIPSGFSSSADILQYLIEKKLAIHPNDRDMIVMLHEMEYEKDGKKNKTKSSLVVKGEDSLRTAMAKTVGLPLGIAVKLILHDKIKSRGLQIPIHEDIYQPVLAELAENGISFHNETETI